MKLCGARWLKTQAPEIVCTLEEGHAGEHFHKGPRNRVSWISEVNRKSQEKLMEEEPKCQNNQKSPKPRQS